MIRMIYASTPTSVIGRNNTIPWHVSDDYKLFKEKTYGDIVVMGRRTYDSLPEKSKPLPGRHNIVISRQTDLQLHPDVTVVNNFNDVLLCYNDKDVWVIGGAEIFRLVLPFVDEIHHTTVYTDVEGDSVFHLPDIDAWYKIDDSGICTDSVSGIDYRVRVYKYI